MSASSSAPAIVSPRSPSSGRVALTSTATCGRDWSVSGGRAERVSWSPPASARCAPAVRAEFAESVPAFDLQGALRLTRRGREFEAIIETADAAEATRTVDRVRAASPESLTVESLSLEEIFVATLAREGNLV